MIDSIMDRDELVQILDDKLRGLELRLEQKLEEKLQPLWQAVNKLSGRVSVIEEKLEAVAEDLRQIKYDTASCAAA